ncbi:MAG: DEAD/DEAH box helicase family protein [Candidatus Gastranaerophilales bacterium]|nr:DEAD/DEAH box helicase family protein [Candidatus Gastranaerophilales bacterium]
MNKKDLSERDICTKFITPAIINAGWNKDLQIREEVSFTAGKVIVRGKLVSRGKAKRADYILYYKNNIPLAVIEAKDNKHNVGAGIQQAIEYAETLDIPFVFSSNGDAFLFHDRTVDLGKKELELPLDKFPTPNELWKKFKKFKQIEDIETEKVYTQNYHKDVSSNKEPRYYQRIAINRAVEAIAKGQDRVLLVMATGTGKTYTAFQIIWRLWKSKKKKRILFLADRNILVDQTKNQDFAPFGNKMTKITKRHIDKSYEIYLSLYQGITGNDEDKDAYKQFSKDFFDLIVIDECHRGSAKEDSAWREILDYFSSATHLGLTATPKETKEVSNIEYFGDPIYTYSLKQGIEDGFLAPYKVIRPLINIDLDGLKLPQGTIDKYGNEIPDEEFNTKDFDKRIVVDERTELVAKRITQYLKNNSRFDKTIVFCTDIDHASRMRQALVNENADLVKENSKYIMRITGDNDEGKRELDNFIDPESTYPVIATTSKLMTTGVDAKTCKLIVLESNINSMTEFKQIIGRGTRLRPDYGKWYFTILDFRGVTRLFEDKEFDGNPVQVKEIQEKELMPNDEQTQEEVEELIKNISEDETVVELPPDISIIDIENPTKKFYVNGIEVVQVGERVQYYGKDGKLITESLIDYTKKNLKEQFANLDEFLKKWSETDKKSAIIEELEEQGILFNELREEVKQKTGKELSIFDLICHVTFDMPPLSRKERAEKVKKRNYFGKYSEKARAVLNALIDKFADTGIIEIESREILNFQPFDKIGTPVEIIKEFGGKTQYEEAIRELEKELFNDNEVA